MSDYTEITSGYGLPSFALGYSDLVVILADSPRETDFDGTAADATGQGVIAASNFSLDVKQHSVADERYAGEGADANVIAVGHISTRASLRSPLVETVYGWPEPSFLTLWDRARTAFWGTATAAIGNLLFGSSTIPSGQSTLQTNNIADFLGIDTPFSATLIGEGETTETVTVTAVSRSQRQLTLQAPTQHAHSLDTQVVVRQAAITGPEREPAFSLFSLREGMLSPCLVNKITLDAKADGVVEVSTELAALRMFRDRQIDLRAERTRIQNEWATLDPIRLVHGFGVRIEAASALAKTFGLSSALGEPLFGGYQGLGLPDCVVTGISITVDNRLKEVYAAHSMARDKQKRQRENCYPWALVSEGRVISGKLTYRAPLDAWLVAERIAGPSALNGGGLKINYGPFSIALSELAWSPSSSQEAAENEMERTLEFVMISDGHNTMPRLEHTV